MTLHIYLPQKYYNLYYFANYMPKIRIITKLWKRPNENRGMAISKVVLQGLGLDKSYEVKWKRALPVVS
jgi:hypothetical protein